MKAGNNQITGNGFHLQQMISRLNASDTETYSVSVELAGDIIINVDCRGKASVTKVENNGGIYQHTVVFPCGCTEVKRKRAHSNPEWSSKILNECHDHLISRY